MQIRRAKLEDVAEILACLAKAFAPYRQAYSEGAWRDTVLDAESLERRLGEMSVLVAEREGIVGTVAYRIEQGDEAHLRGMAVLPDERGSGVAQARGTRAGCDGDYAGYDSALAEGDSVL